jgi:hypothetical protein
MTTTGRRTTIVAFYGPEPGPLDDLVADLQARLTSTFGDGFRPRPPETVHATVIGLERRIGTRPDIDGVAGYLDAALRNEPLCLRFGGFPETTTHPGFDEEGPLFERTLFVQDGNVVLMGWPVDPADPDRPTNRLAALRKGCERYGFVHKYHDPDRPALLDPDAYLVLGRLQRRDHPLGELTRPGPLARPTLIPLRPADLRIVEFEDSTLPTATSSARPLSAAG